MPKRPPASTAVPAARCQTALHARRRLTDWALVCRGAQVGARRATPPPPPSPVPAPAAWPPRTLRTLTFRRPPRDGAAPDAPRRRAGGGPSGPGRPLAERRAVAPRAAPRARGGGQPAGAARWRRCRSRCRRPAAAPSRCASSCRPCSSSAWRRSWAWRGAAAACGCGCGIRGRASRLRAGRRCGSMRWSAPSASSAARSRAPRRVRGSEVGPGRWKGAVLIQSRRRDGRLVRPYRYTKASVGPGRVGRVGRARSGGVGEVGRGPRDADGCRWMPMDADGAGCARARVCVLVCSQNAVLLATPRSVCRSLAAPRSPPRLLGVGAAAPGTSDACAACGGCSRRGTAPTSRGC